MSLATLKRVYCVCGAFLCERDGDTLILLGVNRQLLRVDFTATEITCSRVENGKVCRKKKTLVAGILTPDIR